MSDLRKSISFPELVALGAAGVIGTSWIYTNGTFFAKYGAGGEIFGLVVGVILALFVALAYAELVAKFPRAGGEIVFGYLGFNRVVGFAAGWLLIGAYVSSLAFYVTATGSLLSKVVPSLTTLPVYSVAGTTVHLPVLLIGVLLAIVVCVINALGMSLGARIQLLFFIVILLLGAALAITGFAHGSVSNFWPPYKPEKGIIAPTLRFVLPAMTFLTGFSLVAILAEDANMTPGRIAGAVIATIVLAGAFYCIVLLGSAWIIPWTQTATLKQGSIDAYRIAGFPLLGWSAYAIALLGLLTSFLALFVASSRLMLALARAGLFPQVFARIDEKRGTPINALILTLVLTIGLGALGQSALIWFLDTGGVYVGLAWLIGVLSMYRVRRRYPHVGGAYRVRIAWLPAVGAVAATLIIVFTIFPGMGMSLVWPYEYGILAAWIVLGMIIYALAPRQHDDSASLRALLGDQYDQLQRESNK